MQTLDCQNTFSFLTTAFFAVCCCTACHGMNEPEREVAGCGQRALALVRTMCNGEDVAYAEIKKELGERPLSIREIEAELISRGLSVDIRDVNDGRLYEHFEKLRGGEEPVVAMALIGADLDEVGHYFVFYRTPSGDIVGIEPVSGNSTVLKDHFVEQPFMLLLVSRAPLSNFPKLSFPAKISILALFSLCSIYWLSLSTLSVMSKALSFVFLSTIGSISMVSMGGFDAANNASPTEAVLSEASSSATAEADSYIVLRKEVGRIPVASEVDFQFEIPNSREAAVRFFNFGQSCGCIKLHCAPETVQPGGAFLGSGSITVARPGTFTQRIYCSAETPDGEIAYEITLEGVAEEGVWLEERELTIGPISIDNGKRTESILLPALWGQTPVRCTEVQLNQEHGGIALQLDKANSENGFSRLLVEISCDVEPIQRVQFEAKFESPSGRIESRQVHLNILVSSRPQFVPQTLLVSRTEFSKGWIRSPSALKQPFRLVGIHKAVSLDSRILESFIAGNGQQINAIEVKMDESLQGPTELAILDANGTRIADFLAIPE